MKFAAQIWAGISITMLLGCGYHLVRPGPVFGLASVGIMPFAEQQVAGISAQLSQSLAIHLQADGLKVVADTQQADAILSGTIGLVTVPGTTLRSVQVYLVEAHVHAELRDRYSQVVWQTDLVLQENYLPIDQAVSQQPLATEMRRRVALARLGEAAGQQVSEALRVDASVGKTAR